MKLHNFRESMGDSLSAPAVLETQALEEAFMRQENRGNAQVGPLSQRQDSAEGIRVRSELMSFANDH
jgi:hypothetical protein